MASSGTNSFFPDILEIVEEAYEMSGREMRSGYELRSAIRSIDLLMLEWANRGYNLWLTEETSLTTTSGTVSYNLSADTLDIIEMSVVVSDQDYPLRRMSGVNYMQQVDKESTSRPTAYWIKRTVGTPTVSFWPTPNDTYTVKYWHLRRVEDAGAATNTMDVPNRFIPALISGLAHKLAVKNPDSVDRIPYLEAEAEKQWSLAAAEDREKSSLYLRARVR